LTRFRGALAAADGHPVRRGPSKHEAH
jgi:hypothetical protein